MAHHNRTSENVLSAPTLKPRYRMKHLGDGRKDRRHFEDLPTHKQHNIPKAAVQPSINETYVKPRRTT